MSMGKIMLSCMIQSCLIQRSHLMPSSLGLRRMKRTLNPGGLATLCGERAASTADESTCCTERTQFRTLMEINEASCLSICECFYSLVMDPDVLLITLTLIHDTKTKGPLPDPIPNRYVLLVLTITLYYYNSFLRIISLD